MGEEWETVEIPAELRAAADQARHDLFEKLADHDPEVMEKYVHEEAPAPEELRRAIRKATLEATGTPVLCGSAFKNKAIQPLLDAIVQYLPSPLDVPPVTGLLPKGGEEQREASDDAPFSALAFKIMSDPYVGRLTYMRVYSGKVRAGAHIENSSKDRKERIGRILQMHANHREDMEAAFTGDIVAVVGLKHTSTGDTLCDPSKPIILESITFPTPVISVAVEPKTKADQEKLATSMAKLADEDPTFIVKYRPSSPGWGSSTWRSSSTAWCASSTWARTWASPKWPTARRSASRCTRWRASSSARPAAAASTATRSSTSSRPAPAAATSS
jgi:elongation factor G